MISIITDSVRAFYEFTDSVNKAFYEFSSELISMYSDWTDKLQIINTDEKHPEAVSVQPPDFQQEKRNTSVLTEIQRKLFEHWVRCSTSPQWLVIRSQIILALDDGKAKYQIAREQKRDVKTVRKWAKRWQTAKKELSKTETSEMNNKEYKKYCKQLIAAVGDATRPGRPIIFTAEQVVQLIAMACEVRDGSDEATSHWTWGEIVSEAVRRGIVENISRSSVGRFLNEAQIKPHLSRYWLNSHPEDPEQFEREITIICTLYRASQALYELGIYVISTDEKTGIQALEREYPTHPAKPYKDKTSVELREQEYERHGTLCLTANFEVATGRIISPTIAPARKEEDFLNHIKRTIAADTQGMWIFVTDQLNTHMSESLVRLVAAECNIEEDLGIKGKSGILESMVTRKAFLSDPDHRIHFVYTPKHTSWMNQVELWFSIITRRLLKRGSFHSTDHLRERILKFIDFFNETMAKPFKWTYKGRPLTV